MKAMRHDESECSVHADLHTHTSCSDGTKPPAALVAAAAARDLRVLSVTDHDTIAGLVDARAAAEQQGIEFVNGVELSVTLAGDEIHLLAYGFDPEHEGLTMHLRRMREGRRRRAWDMLKQLRRHGLDIDDEHLEAQVEGTAAPGRPHVAAALVAAGHVDTSREAFEEYIGEGGPGFVAKPTADVTDVLAHVHEAGGVGVIAHPGHWMSSQTRRELVEAGVDGIEVYHPSHRSSLAGYYRRWAEGAGLLVTGGSDYHGRAETDERDFGTVGLSRSAWERFRAFIA